MKSCQVVNTHLTAVQITLLPAGDPTCGTICQHHALTVTGPCRPEFQANTLVQGANLRRALMVSLVC
jgi:hypothetical protein